MASTLRLGVMYKSVEGIPHIIKAWPIREEFGRSYCGLPIGHILPVLGADNICVSCDKSAFGWQ